MARIVPNALALRWVNEPLADQLYSALDPCLTLEIAHELLPDLNPNQQATYDFERVLQGPALDMMHRGIAVDEDERQALLRKLRGEKRKARGAADRTAREAGWVKLGLVTAKVRPCPGRKQHKWPRGVPDAERKCEACGCDRQYAEPFNPDSPTQVKNLLYDFLKLPKKFNKYGTLSTEKEVLTDLYDQCPDHRAVLLAITNYRHVTKLIDMAGSRCGPDGRMHQSLNVGATETGRWSSSEDCFREGMNLMNVPRELRSMFVATPGWVLFQADLEQAESRRIAYWTQDERYIAAHDTGNVHVWVGRNVLWPEGLVSADGTLLHWTGDDKADKALMKSTPLPWNPALTYYDTSKRNQHGGNYGLKPRGMAKHMGAPYSEGKRAFQRYHAAFPRIKDARAAVSTALRRERRWVTPFGRERMFMGRPWDEATVREGLANDPQSFVADYLNIGLLRVWYELCPNRVRLLSQGYDSVLGEFREGDEAVLDIVRELMHIEVEVEGGRTMAIPVDIGTGARWSECG